MCGIDIPSLTPFILMSYIYDSGTSEGARPGTYPIDARLNGWGIVQRVDANLVADVKLAKDSKKIGEN